MSDIKIRSKYLNVLNEAIQKMVINDTIKAFTPVIVEADGKFSSVLNTNDDFDLSSLGSNIESTDVSTEENSEQEVNETKTQLLNKAKNAMNKSLEASNEFQQILAKIKKLSQTTDFDTWVVNKEGNTASLKSKKANIFKQNNNLCLSHEGKIELFKSVPELHNWLKQNNYPLPKNIEIHESTELKENFDLFDKYKEYISKEVEKNNSEYNNRKSNILPADKFSAYFDKVQQHKKAFQNAIAPLSKELNQLESEYNDLSPKEKLHSKLGAAIREKQQQIDEIRKKYAPKKDIRDAIKKMDAHRNEMASKYAYEMNKTYTLAEPEYKKIISGEEKPSYKVDDYNAPFVKKECGVGGVTTSALGPAVSYTANKKELTEEDDLFLEAGTNAAELLGFRDGVNIPTELNGAPKEQKDVAGHKAVKYLLGVANLEDPAERAKRIKQLKNNNLTPDDWNVIKAYAEKYIKRNIAIKAYTKVLDNVFNEFFPEIERTKYIALDMHNNKDLITNNAEFYEKLKQGLINRIEAEAKRLNTTPGGNYDYEFDITGLPPAVTLLPQDSNDRNRQTYDNFGTDFAKLQTKAPLEVVRKVFIDDEETTDTDTQETPVDSSDSDITNAINILKAKGLSSEEILSMLNSKSESVFTEAVNSYPWLKKLFKESVLTEDDTPADFAKGSPLEKNTASNNTPDLDLGDVDLKGNDTSSTDKNDLDLNDLDLDGDTSSEYSKDFGNLGGGFGGGLGGEDSEEAPALDLPKQKIIKVLVNDNDPTDVKVVVENEDKTTETLPLSEIDI